jgi:hypothetical protein
MNTKPSITLGFFLGLCLLLQGCFGGGVMTRQTTAYQQPVVYAEAGHILSVHERNAERDTNAVAYTPEWLKQNCGKPAAISRVGPGSHDQIWSYNRGTIWEGVFLYVGVGPIPIALPVAKEKIQLVLRDGQVTSATNTRPHKLGGAFGMGFGPCGFACGAASIDE